mmetsp:Transcript_13663/g.47400  ORF Transcript_13663/g.47400 Transcript_13663/m.47400 type:complete len:515 (-) Transcript_13663:7-1551(-)
MQDQNSGQQVLTPAKGEVILTVEEAKRTKLQKGYNLEPVLQNPSKPPELLPAKRERKKSNHFGHSPPNEPTTPARQMHKPKAVSAQRPLLQAEPPVSNNPWTERKKQLQDRLRRINAQLKKINGGVCNVVAAPKFLPAASPAGWARAPGSPFYSTPINRQRDVADAFSHASSGGSFDSSRQDRKRKEPSTLTASKPESSKRRKSKKTDRLAPKGKMKNLYLHCEKLLETLMKEKACVAYFNIPVDPIALGIPQYMEIIKKPMDLGTVKEKLESECYDHVEALAADINLVWDNAMYFNPAGTDVHECAKALKDSTEKRIKKLPKVPGTQKEAAGVDLPAGRSAESRTLMEMMREVEILQRDLAEVKQKSQKQSASTGRKRPTGATPSNKAMTFEEKRTLRLNINKLEPDKLGKVVEIIKKRMSNIVGNSEEIEIDMDMLDNATLRELERYVNECFNPKQKKPTSKAAALKSAAQQAVSSAHGVEHKGKESSSDSESESDWESDQDKSALNFETPL